MPHLVEREAGVGGEMTCPRLHSESVARSADIWIQGPGADRGRHMTPAYSRKIWERKFKEPNADSALSTCADHKDFWEGWVQTAFQAIS